MSKTKKLTLCAIFCALGVVVLMLGSLIEVIDLSSAALAAFFIYIAVIEIGGFYPHILFMSTAILSLVLLPVKLPVVFYIGFFGHYAIFKSYIEKFHYLVAWGVKFSYFNVLLTLIIYASSAFLNLNEPILALKFTIFGIANVAFLLYDIAVTRIITLYIVKFRRRLKFRDIF